MKLLCAIIKASDFGDKLQLELQGSGVAEYEGAACAAQALAVPMTDRNRRTFYVGRQVTIEVKPRGR